MLLTYGKMTNVCPPSLSKSTNLNLLIADDRQRMTTEFPQKITKKAAQIAERNIPFSHTVLRMNNNSIFNQARSSKIFFWKNDHFSGKRENFPFPPDYGPVSNLFLFVVV